MRRAELPISALPAWMKLNDVILYDISVHDVERKGFGFIADTALSSEEAFDMPVLLRVPKDLILSTEAVKEHARVDKDFNELLTAAGGVVRHDRSHVQSLLIDPSLQGGIFCSFC
jgi:hypothetical protein